MANCEDNSYIIYYTNLDKGTIQLQKSALETDRMDIALIGKTRLEYGEVFNENILHLLENFAAPAVGTGDPRPDTSKTTGTLLDKPIAGQIWYNKTQQIPSVYGSDNQWRQFGSTSDAGGNSGVLAHGEYLPMPIADDGYNFAIDECAWNVSPFHIPEEVDFIHCFADPVGRVTMQYRLEGDVNLRSGFANYQIIGIRGNTNLGTIDCQSGPAPTTTPMPSTTPTPMVTPTHSPTPSITPSVTVTMTPNITPTITPTVTLSVSLSVTPTPTAEPTVTPTPSVTATVTPTISLTPTLTPTITLTPSVTPSTAVNNGDVFLAGIRPYGGYDDEAYYVRKVEQNSGLIRDGFQQVADYYNIPGDNYVAPTDSKRGVMYRGSYLTTGGVNLYAFGVNLGQGVYPVAGEAASNATWLPMTITSDGNFVYAGLRDDSNPLGVSSMVGMYRYSGGRFVQLGPNSQINLGSTNIDGIFPLGSDLVLVKSYPIVNNVEKGTAFTVLKYNNATQTLEADGAPTTFEYAITGTAVRNANNIVVVDDQNVLNVFKYVPGTGLELVTTLDLKAYFASPVVALQYDMSWPDLFIAGLTGNANETKIIRVDSANYTTVNQFTLNKATALVSRNSITAFEGIIGLIGVNASGREFITIKYVGTSFVLVDTDPVTPADREVEELTFILPDLPRPTPTPTPTPSTSVSETPPVTPTRTPEVTPTPTPSPSDSTGPVFKGCDPDLPNGGCNVGCDPVVGGCQCGEDLVPCP